MRAFFILRKEDKTMGILDAFAAEDRVDVKFSTFYELVKGCAEREFLSLIHI